MLFPTADEYDAKETEEEFFERKRETLATLSRALLAIQSTGLFEPHQSPDGIACFVNIGDAEDEEATMMFEPVLDHMPEQAKAELRELFGW